MASSTYLYPIPADSLGPGIVTQKKGQRKASSALAEKKPWEIDYADPVSPSTKEEQSSDAPKEGEATAGIFGNFVNSFIASAFHDSVASGASVLENLAKVFGEEAAKTMRGYADSFSEAGQDWRKEAGVDTDTWSSKIGSGAGSLVPLLLPVGTAGAVAKAGFKVHKYAQSAGVLGMVGLHSFGSTYQRARKTHESQGMSATEAADAAVTPAVADGFKEIGVTLLGGAAAKKAGVFDVETWAAIMNNPAAREAISKVAKVGLAASPKLPRTKAVAGGVLIEGAEESASSFIGEYAIARTLYDPTITLDQAIEESWDSFVVGVAIGAPGSVVSASKVQKAAKEAARINSLKDAAPQTARAIDNQEGGFTSLVPDDNTKVPGRLGSAHDKDPSQLPELPEGSTPTFQDKKKSLSEQLLASLPDWWLRFAEVSGPDGSPVLSGLKYADTDTINQIIEDQELSHETMGKITVEQVDDGRYEVKYEGRKLSEQFSGSEGLTRKDYQSPFIRSTKNETAWTDRDLLFETKQDANLAARQLALDLLDNEASSRVASQKEFVSKMRDLEEAERSYEEQIRKVASNSARRAEDPQDQEASQADKQFVANYFKIPVGHLSAAGITVTPDLVQVLQARLPLETVQKLREGLSPDQDQGPAINLSPELVQDLRTRLPSETVQALRARSQGEPSWRPPLQGPPVPTSLMEGRSEVLSDLESLGEKAAEIEAAQERVLEIIKQKEGLDSGSDVQAVETEAPDVQVEDTPTEDIRDDQAEPARQEEVAETSEPAPTPEPTPAPEPAPEAEVDPKREEFISDTEGAAKASWHDPKKLKAWADKALKRGYITEDSHKEVMQLRKGLMAQARREKEPGQKLMHDVHEAWDKLTDSLLPEPKPSPVATPAAEPVAEPVAEQAEEQAPEAELDTSEPAPKLSKADERQIKKETQLETDQLNDTARDLATEGGDVKFIEGLEFPVRGNADALAKNEEVLGLIKEAFSQLSGTQFLHGLKTITVAGKGQDVGGAGLASGALFGVTDTIYINPSTISRAKARGLDVGKAIEEELIHNIDGMMILKEYDALKESGKLGNMTPGGFVRKYYLDLASSMSPDQVEAARKEYGHDFATSAHAAAEFVRQVTQKEHGHWKITTEESYNNNVIKNFLTSISRHLGLFKGKLEGSSDPYSSKIQSHLDAVNDYLAGRDAYIEANPDVEASQDMDLHLLMNLSMRAAKKLNDGGGVYGGFSLDELANQIRETIYKNQRSGKIDADRTDPVTGLPRSGYFDVTAKQSMTRLYEKQEGKKGGKRRETRDKTSSIDDESGDKPGGEAKNVVDKKTQEEAWKERSAKLEAFTEFIENNREALKGVGADFTDDMIAFVKFLAEGSTLASLGKRGNLADVKRAQEKAGIEGDVYRASERVKGAVGAVRELERSPDPRKSKMATEFLELMKDATYIRAAMPATPRDRSVLKSLIESMRGAWSSLSKEHRFIPSRHKLKNSLRSDGGMIITNEQGEVDFMSPLRERDGYVNSAMNVVGQESRRIRTAIGKQFGKEPTKEQIELVDDALKGSSKAIAKLDTELAQAINAARFQIDELSRYMVAKGYIKDKLADVVMSRVGTYLTRSYEIFDNKNFKPSDAVRKKAVDLVEKNLLARKTPPKDPRLEAETIIDDLLTEYKKKSGRDGFMKGKVGTKDLSLFMKKKEDLAPEIKELMGEYHDPMINYAKTISRMAHFIGNQKFLEDIKKAGVEGKVFFDKEDSSRFDFGARTRIGDKKKKKGGESLSAYSPLEGLYTTEEVAELLENYHQSYQDSAPAIFRGYMALNFASKAAATIGSPMGHARNFIGQTGFWMNSGHHPFQIKRSVEAAKVVWADGAGDNKKRQAYYNKLTKLGIVGEDVTVAELTRALSTSQQLTDIDPDIDPLAAHYESNFLKGVDIIKKKGKAGWKAATGLWRASDEIGKIVGWELEVDKLSVSRPDLKREQVEAEAARRVRDTYPTYSMLPPAIQAFRTQPVVGPFISFHYEAMRTQYNSIAYAMKDIQEGRRKGRPAQVKHGIQRAVGVIGAAGQAYGLQVLSTLTLLSFGKGVTDEEEENFRELLPEYEANDQFILWRNEGGKVEYINVSYNHPYSAASNAILGIFGLSGKKEDTISKQIFNNAFRLFEPFYSKTIITGKAIEAASGRTNYGKQIWTEADNLWDASIKGTTHVVSALVPSGLTRLRNRMIPAAGGHTLPTGEEPRLENELMNELLGIKHKTLDYEQALKNRSYQTSKALSDANWRFNREVKSKGTLSRDDLSVLDDDKFLELYAEANEDRLAAFSKAARQVTAAKIGGLPMNKIIRSMKDAGITQEDAIAIYRGHYRPLPITREGRYKRKLPMMEIRRLERRFKKWEIPHYTRK